MAAEVHPVRLCWQGRGFCGAPFALRLDRMLIPTRLQEQSPVWKRKSRSAPAASSMAILRGYYYGYWIKIYEVPADTLEAKKRLIDALTRRLFNHVEHGLNVPGRRLDEARRAYDTRDRPRAPPRQGRDAGRRAVQPRHRHLHQAGRDAGAGHRDRPRQRADARVRPPPSGSAVARPAGPAPQRRGRHRRVVGRAVQGLHRSARGFLRKPLRQDRADHARHRSHRRHADRHLRSAADVPRHRRAGTRVRRRRQDQVRDAAHRPRDFRRLVEIRRRRRTIDGLCAAAVTCMDATAIAGLRRCAWC